MPSVQKGLHVGGKAFLVQKLKKGSQEGEQGSTREAVVGGRGNVETLPGSGGGPHRDE